MRRACVFTEWVSFVDKTCVLLPPVLGFLTRSEAVNMMDAMMILRILHVIADMIRIRNVPYLCYDYLPQLICIYFSINF